MKKLLCWLLGHRSICLHRFTRERDIDRIASSVTAWKCERCGKTVTEQWDE